ncbi:hypothetical protein L5220_05120 [Synechococcus sp. PCC 6716]|nr:hypothetical protein [Synechococcus sp. PCC 6716]
MFSVRLFGRQLSVLVGVVTLFAGGAIAQPVSLIARQNQPTQLADGIYLFGESPQPHQTGHGYIVFEVSNQQVRGAFYLPNSSFDCFVGTVGDQQLDVTVEATYDDETYPAHVDLFSFYSLDHVSPGDRAILSACHAN